MMLSYIVLAVFVCIFLPNQNNPTAIWLRFIGKNWMHNEKIRFFKT